MEFAHVERQRGLGDAERVRQMTGAHRAGGGVCEVAQEPHPGRVGQGLEDTGEGGRRVAVEQGTAVVGQQWMLSSRASARVVIDPSYPILTFFDMDALILVLMFLDTWRS
ncbi:hypothetical protein [Tessaracoccus coleopterorum]|uniref:hypothetical protein n=1 Tax=Tessaracoccus coleopterorum TaxID=2714950 RepID=UPI0018D2ABD8|nr:hypothetical protein [Tessaracoccus coleopterorum]